MIDLFIVRQSTRNAMIQTWLFQGRCWGLVGWAFPWGTSRQASLMGVLLPLHTRGRCGTSSCLLASEQSDPAIWGVEWAGRWKTFLSLCNFATINENPVSFTDLHLHSGDMVLYSHPPPPHTHTLAGSWISWSAARTQTAAFSKGMPMSGVGGVWIHSTTMTIFFFFSIKVGITDRHPPYNPNLQSSMPLGAGAGRRRWEKSFELKMESLVPEYQEPFWIKKEGQ